MLIFQRKSQTSAHNDRIALKRTKGRTKKEPSSTLMKEQTKKCNALEHNGLRKKIILVCICHL